MSDKQVKKIFITSWPHGQAYVVNVIAERPDRPGYFYIAYPCGGTDTTTSEFLFDIPDGLVEKKTDGNS